ncbi:MAG: T9SS type A sorting domain-containing protein [Bacteroidia bacterium]|nr:T9SS type A sorting domain-containing protein [Bacteroidia bacterium]
MKQMITFILLGCWLGNVFGQSNTGFIKAIIPSPGKEVVLGKQVDVEKHISNSQIIELVNGDLLNAFRYQYSLDNKSDVGISLYKTNSVGDSIWTRKISLGEDIIFSSPGIELAASPDGGAYLIFSSRQNFSQIEILIKIDALGNILWVKSIDPNPNHSMRSYRVDLFVKSDGEVLIATADSYFSHSNPNGSFSGVGLISLDGNGNFLEKKSFILRGPNGLIHSPILSLNENDELSVAAGIVGIDSALNGKHIISVAAFKVDSSDNFIYKKALIDHQEFLPTDIVSDGSSTRIAIIGYFPIVLTELDSIGNVNFTQVYTSESFTTFDLVPFYIGDTDNGTSIFAPSLDQNSDVVLDLSEGLAAPFIRVDVDEQGEVLQANAQLGGGGNFHDRLNIANGSDNSLLLSYPSFYYEEQIGDSKAGLSVSKIYPASTDTGSCYGQKLDAVAHSATFQEVNVPFEGPFSETQIGSLTGLTSFRVQIGNYPISIENDTVFLYELCEPAVGGSGPPLTFTTETSLVSTFPNPTNGMMTVKMEADMGTVDVQLQDLSGRIYMQQRLESEAGSILEMDMTGMNAGIYYLSIKGIDFSVRKKLVKVK